MPWYCRWWAWWMLRGLHARRLRGALPGSLTGIVGLLLLLSSIVAGAFGNLGVFVVCAVAFLLVSCGGVELLEVEERWDVQRLLDLDRAVRRLGIPEPEVQELVHDLRRHYRANPTPDWKSALAKAETIVTHWRSMVEEGRDLTHPDQELLARATELEARTGAVLGDFPALL